MLTGCALCQERLPIPSEQELQGWIPSQRFPSDHLSLVFDFAWRNSSSSSATASISHAADSQAPHAEPDAALSNGAVPESSSDAMGEAYNTSSLPAYHTDGLLENGADQQAPKAGGPCLEQPDSMNRRQQQQDIAGCNGQSSSPSAEPADAQALRSSHAAQGLVLPADAAHIPAAAAALARGAIVALPTDTLYGLAACANNQQVELPAVPELVLLLHSAQLGMWGFKLNGRTQ